jgi:hypothetical protein
MRTLRNAIVGAAALAVVCVPMLSGASSAAAAMPWWHLNVVSAPASTPGGEGTIIVEASNLGDVPIEGAEDPVTIVDKLPPGVTATSFNPSGGGGAIGRNFVHLFMSCSGVATVTCSYPAPLLQYERLMIQIRVKIAPGTGSGVNEISLSGGGAQSVTSHHRIPLDGASPYGLENYELTPEEEGGAPDTQAGSHPFQLTTTFTLNSIKHPTKEAGGEGETEVQPVALTKDLRFNLPPGLIGNPTPVPQCSQYVFTQMMKGNGECPADTVVGVAAVTVVREGFLSPYGPLGLTEPLYNLEPSTGEPAKFGFRASEGGPVILDTAVRTGGNYGVVVTVANISELLGTIGSQVTFWGTPDDSRHDTARGVCLRENFNLNAPELGSAACPGQEHGQPFLIQPTSCLGPLKTSLEADSWTSPGQFTAPEEYTFQNSAGEPYGLDGCNRLNFEPSISLTPDGQQGSTPTGLTVGVHVPQEASLNAIGLADSTVKDTTVTLPVGVGLNPAGADGLQSCGLDQIALESAAEQTCPEAAKVGTLEIKSPLLPNPLVGAAYLAQQNANPFGSLVALYLVARDPVSGVLIKLAGQVVPDPVTGQLVSTFKETPQLPFEDLKLHFFGGSRAPLGTPALCGTYTTTASIAPWSGNAPVDSSSEFQVTSGPNGTPCSNPLPFAPTLTTGATNIQAGAFTPFTMTMSREDGNQNLKAIQLKMPPGLLGTLSNVKLCGEAQANAGTCGPESLIGHTIVSVGLGGNPFTVTGGQVFITGPYKGAPYGLSIVNPAKAGPFDLGSVVVRAKVEVDPITAALRITTDTDGPYSIPQIIDGIPLQIKHVNVTIDRPDFTFNPTNCSKTAITGSLTSSEGASSALSVPFQVTNCATLGFKPLFKVSTNGKTSRAKGASLSVKLTYPKAAWGTQANIKSVKVDLPKQMPSELRTLQHACPNQVFEANPAACPSASRVGSATATTPIIPVGLSGPAYFVSYGGAKFPELVIVLSGYGVTVDLHGETFINPAGITSSTFRSIPDVPIGGFELNLPQGTFSALGANANLCKVKGGLKMPTVFVAQNGLVIHQSTPISVSNCAKAKAKAHAGHKKK